MAAPKDGKYYKALKEKYEQYIKLNDFLIVPQEIDAVKTRTITCWPPTWELGE